MKDKYYGFENLVVWQKAHELVLNIYNLTKSFPQEEFTGLTSQFRKAATTIAVNIAEGYSKQDKNDTLWFYNTAEDAINECCYYAILAKDLGYLKEVEDEKLMEELSAMQKMLKSYTLVIRKNPSSKV
ncbi:four helix bundle protein [Parabacteroides sp. OttesenSCG-928-G07]|nr:four helix bundle protein [Parabacteroides sp. OttesenSCG-928-G07]